MKKPGILSPSPISDRSLAAVDELVRSIRMEKYAAAVLFSRQGNLLAADGTPSALVAGTSSLVLKCWRKLQPLESAPDDDLPAVLIAARFASAKWDSRLLRARIEEVLQHYWRGHHPLPIKEAKFRLDWHCLKTAETVDTARQWLKANRRVARRRPARATEQQRESPLDAIASTAELERIMAELERIKQPLRVRLQRVLDGLAEQTLESSEVNARVVKQINALRTALGVGLRLKDSQEPIYLRCVVTSGAKTATIQAVSADQQRTNLAASAEYPALEVFEPGTDA